LFGPPVASRVERTFAFVDLCGFTRFADEQGDELAADVLHLLRGSVREAASRQGVRVDKWLGDGAMLVSVEPSPLLVAVTDVACAMANEAPLPMRAGLAAGQVMVFDGEDYVGRVINLASRLCEMAGDGCCLAPAWLGGVCPEGLVSRAVGTVSVSGFARPLDLVAIEASEDDHGRHRHEVGSAIGVAVQARVRRARSGGAAGGRETFGPDR
jgi:class 3 adenylate cyclase